MKVDSNAAAVQLNAYMKQVRNQEQTANARTQQEHAQPAAGTDKVEISPQAQEVQKASETLKAMPDTRPEKVAQVKMEVDKGTYNVPGAKAATSMLKEAFENDTILQKISIKA